MRNAAADAGLAAVPPAVDSIRVVSSLSWSYGNPAWLLAAAPRHSRRRARRTRTPVATRPRRSSTGPPLDIAAGDSTSPSSSAARRGARARAPSGRARASTGPRRPRAAAGDDRRRPRHDPPGRGRARRPPAGAGLPDVRDGDPGRRRARARRAPRHISELWSRFSEVAATTRSRLDRATRQPPRRSARSPPTNRLDRLAVPQVHELQQRRRHGRGDRSCARRERAAALGVAARPLGVPPRRHRLPRAPLRLQPRDVRRHAGHRARRPAGARAGRLGIDDVALVDLYSCFPSAVQLGARSRSGSTLDRSAHPHRRAGVRRRAVEQLRDARHRHGGRTSCASGPASRALVWANGGYATKHAFGVYATAPPAAGFRHDRPQAEIDALPPRRWPSPATRPARRRSRRTR